MDSMMNVIIYSI